jgi:hypothetical protein
LNSEPTREILVKTLRHKINPTEMRIRFEVKLCWVEEKFINFPAISQWLTAYEHFN